MKNALLLLSALAFPWPALAISIEQEIPASMISVSASSEYGTAQSARHLIDGSGLANGRHDNEGSARTMWHSTQKPSPKPPAPGLAPSPAWVRFDFAPPQKFDAIRIWNHNQANLTDRGFRKTRIYGSSDGATWFALTSPEAIELPRASGSHGAGGRRHRECRRRRAPLKSVIIAAEAKDGNYGSDYYGLSAVRFGVASRSGGSGFAGADGHGLRGASLLSLPARRQTGPRNCRLASGRKTLSAR